MEKFHNLLVFTLVLTQNYRNFCSFSSGNNLPPKTWFNCTRPVLAFAVFRLSHLKWGNKTNYWKLL